MEGLEGRPLEPFSFHCRPELRYCRIPHFGKPRSMTPLENNSSELWLALKSPLLSTKDSLQCHAKPPNEHYKSCKHFTLNNDTQRERQKQFTTWILAGWLIGLTSQINMQYICKFEKKNLSKSFPSIGGHIFTVAFTLPPFCGHCLKFCGSLRVRGVPCVHFSIIGPQQPELLLERNTQLSPSHIHKCSPSPSSHLEHL